ncbi:MAG: tyrosine-type recombinase/integrase [Thermoanaerobaculia bacterium]
MSHSPTEWHLADAKILTPEEFRSILAKCRELGEFDPYWLTMYDIIAIGVNTGLRISEILHIEKDDVLPSRLMVIRRKKKHLHPEPIEIMPAIHKLIAERAATVEAGFIFPGKQAPCFIEHQGKRGEELGREQFCCGGHASIRNAQRRWRLIVTELGLYKYGRGIHSTRHGAITTIYQKTKDLRKAQVFAGHSSSQITERYAHITDMRETLASLPTML